MSEVISQQNDSFDDIVSSVEKWAMDPVLIRMFAVIREYNQLLLDSPQTKAEIQAIMNDVDSKYQDLIGASCKLTGYATFPNIWHFDPVHDLSESEPVPVVESYFEDETVHFNGVVPCEIAQSAEDEDDSVLYELQISLKKDEHNIDGGAVLLLGRCNLDQIADFEFDNIMSIPRSTAILESLQPKLLDKIDFALLNPGPDTPANERLMRMKGLCVDPYKLDLPENLQLITKALHCYTTYILRLDNVIPHAVSVDGPIWVKNDDDEYLTTTVSGNVLFMLDDVTWMTSPGSDEDCAIPHIMGRISDSDTEKPMPMLMIPLESISSLESVRDKFFAINSLANSSELEYSI